MNQFMAAHLAADGSQNASEVFGHTSRLRLIETLFKVEVPNPPDAAGPAAPPISSATSASPEFRGGSEGRHTAGRSAGGTVKTYEDETDAGGPAAGGDKETPS